MSRYQKKHSPTILIVVVNHPYLLSPSTATHGILRIQSTCSTVFFHNLSPSFLWSTSWPGTPSSYSIHFFTQSLSSFRSTCPYHRNLFHCSTEIMSSKETSAVKYNTSGHYRGTNCLNLFHPIRIVVSTAASASPSTLNMSPK